jgi:GMP synthase (glutamine-hydrolysing)
MGELLIIQNISREGPGLLEQVLIDERIPFDVVDVGNGHAFPTLDGYKALVVLGGPGSANNTTPTMIAQLARIKECVKAGIPYLGVCLGLQTLVKACGGDVVPGNVHEVGFLGPDDKQYTVALTDAGKTDPLFAGLPEVLAVFQLHGETVGLTPEMTLLATGKFCRNQVVKVAPKAYGIQSHCELTPEMLAVWAEQDPDLIPTGQENLLADFANLGDSYSRTGLTLLRNFLRIADLA